MEELRKEDVDHEDWSLSFVFEVLRLCDKDQCLFQEQLALTFHHSEYNVSHVASSAMSGRKHSEESKQKMSIARQGKLKSQAWKDARSTTMQNNQVWVGRKHSDETKKRMSEAAKRRWTK